MSEVFYLRLIVWQNVYGYAWKLGGHGHTIATGSSPRYVVALIKLVWAFARTVPVIP